MSETPAIIRPYDRSLFKPGTVSWFRTCAWHTGRFWSSSVVGPCPPPIYAMKTNRGWMAGCRLAPHHLAQPLQWEDCEPDPEALSILRQIKDLREQGWSKTEIAGAFGVSTFRVP